MARAADPIIAYIETLYAHRELISRAYHQGSVNETSENTRGVRALEHASALRSFEGTSFKLTRTLQRTFDVATSRLRSYDRLARIEPRLARLGSLKQSVIEARRLGEIQDMEMAAAEFEDECFAIREDVQRNIFKLRALIDSDFGTATSLREKERQNKFYIAETKAIQSDVLSLQNPSLPADLAANEFYDLAGVYNRMVGQHLESWFPQLRDFWGFIQSMLHRTRQVQKRNSNFAKALLLFQLHPRYEGPDVPVDETSPDWLFQVEPLRIKPNPDVLFPGTELEFAEIATSLMASPQRLVRAEDFEPQTALDDGEPSAQVIELEPDLYDVALHHFLKAVRASTDSFGESAYLWKTRHSKFDALTMPVWLQCLLIEADGDDLEPFNVTPIFEPGQDETVGTRAFSDVSVVARRTSA